MPRHIRVLVYVAIFLILTGAVGDLVKMSPPERSIAVLYFFSGVGLWSAVTALILQRDGKDRREPDSR